MLGSELRKARESAGMSQERLAFEAGVHRTYISLLERDKKSPTVYVLLRICKALGISMADLIARIEKAADEDR
jgi:transcriptional regulator with XRE-family HTH domain